MNTWLYPGWTQGSDNEKLREEAETRDASCSGQGGGDE